MNLNRAVNYLYISLDGQILKEKYYWMAKNYVIELKLRMCIYVTFKVKRQLTQGS